MPNTDEIINRAEELCFLCEEEEAELIVRQALESEPDNLELKTELAIIISRKGHDAKAEKILREVVDQDAYSERAIASLGRLLDSSLRTGEAEALYLEYLRKRPDGHMVLDDLCRLWYDNDEGVKALETARNHAKMYPDQVHAYDALKYVLQMYEDELMAELVEDPEDHKRIISYGRNLLEQYSIAMKLRSIVIDDDETQKYVEDLNEDLIRLRGELRGLKTRYDSENIPRSKDLQFLFEEIEK